MKSKRLGSIHLGQWILVVLVVVGFAAVGLLILLEGHGSATVSISATRWTTAWGNANRTTPPPGLSQVSGSCMNLDGTYQGGGTIPCVLIVVTQTGGVSIGAASPFGVISDRNVFCGGQNCGMYDVVISLPSIGGTYNFVGTIYF